MTIVFHKNHDSHRNVNIFASIVMHLTTNEMMMFVMHLTTNEMQIPTNEMKT
jgi:hypothetical protein